MRYLMFLFLLLGLACGVPVAFALGIVGMVGLVLVSGPAGALEALPTVYYSSLDSFTLVAIPIYIFMANILNGSKASEDLYRMIEDWVGHLPGGLGITTALLCTGFAAISGSSVASAATIGGLALPKMLDAGYERRFSFGIVAAGGTLGILIPPSLFFILYGAMTDVSVGQLFVAGVVPGVVAAVLMLFYVVGHAKYARLVRTEPIPWARRWQSLRDGWWVLPLPVIVLGGIYSGAFTPTEAAAVGVVYSLAATAAKRQLNVDVLRQSLLLTVRTTTMIFFIICGALLFGHVITLLQLPQDLITAVRNLGLSPLLFVVGVCILFVFLGDFLEVVSITLISMPILHPMLLALDVDLIWFGVIMCITMEFALITPPVGLNLFVIQGMYPDADLFEVFRGTWPFMLLLMVVLILVFWFPPLATWLPRTLL